MKINEKSSRMLRDIEATMNECREQKTQIQAFALLGAYSEAVMGAAWIKSNRPEQLELIAGLEALVELKNEIPVSIDFQHNVETFSQMLKETSSLTDVVSGFAYKYAYGKLSERVFWAKFIHADNTELKKEAMEPLKGFNKDRSLNLSAGCAM
jgi:hypothetical protein